MKIARFFRVLFFVMLMMFIISCATPYQKIGWFGGYRDYKIKDNIYTVYFVGKGFINSEKYMQYAKRRAAEITLENGYTHFVIMDNTYEKNPEFIDPLISIPIPFGPSYPEITLTISLFKDNYPKEAVNAKKYLDDNIISQRQSKKHHSNTKREESESKE